MFCDSTPKGIRMKEVNLYINNGNAQICNFPGATSKQLRHYMEVNLDNNIDSVLIHVGIKNMLNSDSNISRLLVNIKDIVNKRRNF